MPRLSFEEVRCASALNRVDAPRMPFRWSLNPYRGCAHSCVYCYAREYHQYLERDGTRDFEQRILVKVNVAEVLREELARPAWRRELVAVGTATDPYQAAEGRYRLTRRCLEVFLAQRTPVSLVTKSTMAVRDREILSRLGRAAGASVTFSITTLREELARRLEPDTPPPRRRLWAMEQLAADGIRVGLALAPLLPGLTDDESNIEEVARAALDHGAQFFFAGLLRLTPVPRRTYLEFLAEARPQLVPAVERLYGGAYAPSAYQREVEARVERVRARLGLDRPAGRAARTLPRPAQLPLGI